MDRKNIETIYKLTPVQQGMLLVTLNAPESGAYFDQFVIPMPRLTDTVGFRAAWQTLVARHAVLRTSFLWEKLDEPVQIVHKQVEIPTHFEDLSSLDPEAQQQTLATYCLEDRRRGFDLKRVPLMRLALFDLGDASRLVWSYHHMLLDGWSVGVVLREMLTLARGGTLAKPPRGFRDYVAWLRKQPQEASESYWRELLGDFDTPTPLPRDGKTRGDFGELLEPLPDPVAVVLQGVAKENRLTLFQLATAAWIHTLARYGGRDDVVFGITLAGRSAPLPGIQNMVGCFINTLPVRGRLDPARSLGNWLQDIRRDSVELLRFEHSALPEVQRWSGVGAQQSLFDSLLVSEGFVSERAGATTHQRTNYPLVMKLVGSGDKVELAVGHDLGIFDPATVRRLTRHFRTVLEDLARGLDRPVATLPALAPSERHQVMVEWDGEARTFPSDLTIDAAIAHQVERRADAVALVGEDADGGRTVLTYAELAERSHRLAHHLRSLGAGPEVLVGVAMERGVELVVALTAILEAGAAYLPIDSSYPADRLAFMLADGGAPLLLTERARVADLPEFEGQVVVLDDPEVVATVSRQPATRPQVASDPDRLAYVIYTSGSTGRPKGVLIPHRNVSRLMAATAEWFDFGPEDVWTFFHSHAFDFSVWEIWGCLMTGGRLVVVPYLTSRSPSALRQLLVDEGVTVLNQTPSAFRQLVAADSEAPEGSELALREVVFGGEALDLASLSPWFERHGDRRPRLVNMYGITETTVHVTYRPLSAGDTAMAGSPVGVAIPDLTLHLNDHRGEPVPVGAEGEIWVGGTGLARGYLGRPGLTAERFVPDPTATAHGTPGARVYRSGDLARYLPSGDLDFLGRIDHQVKVRGFRIELGEIEAALQDHPAVRHAVVLALPDVAGDSRLVAYLVPEGDPSAVSELRQTVASTLPDYMVPQAVVWLDELPLTVNGKLDRKALPAPDEAVRSAAFEPPRTPVEEGLAEIWGEVLGVEQVGAFDDFFELGGHSLRMTQVMSRIRDRFGVEIPLPTLFERPVLAELGAEIEGAQVPGVAAPPLEALADRGRRLREGLPPSFAQERLWFIDQLMPDSAAYNIPGLLELEGPLEVEAFRRALQTVVERHDSLRTRFVARDGKPLQVVEEALELDLPVHDLSRLPEGCRRDELARLARGEAARPFDLASVPLLRVTLVRLADHHHVMVVVMHHIVSDGWSLEVMLGEVEKLYRARLAGVDPRLAPLAIQYPDFALWQREWLESGELDRQLEVWRRRLEGAPTVLELPTDRPATAVRRSGPPITRLSLLDSVDRVEALARSHGATPFMVYLAVLHTLLGRLSGQETVLVGSPIANRTRSETEGLIGFFVNTLVLRGDLGGDPSFATLLGRVRETTLEAYGHQDLPFEHLVGELAPERSIDHTPFFRVVFNLQRVPPQPEGAPATEDEERLSIEPMPLEVATPKFDLTIQFQEDDDRILQQWSGRAELFDPTTIERFRRRYDLLLEGVLADPERRLVELSLLGRSEQHQLTAEWNSPLSSFPARGTIDAAIAAQAAVRGDAVAVVGDSGSLTYRQLDERANRLAHHLRAHGAGPEVLVGVAMERGMELVVALLAILRSGAAYLPIDSSYPRDRLAFMLDDAGAPLLLGERSRAEDLPEFSGRVLLLDDPAEQSAIAARPATAPAIEADPDRLAYVIYTSGSTGLPKGVLIPHRNVMRLMTATESWFRFGPDDVWTFFHSHAFDFSVWEIWGCLVTGGRLVVVPYLTSRSPSAFRQLLADEGVTVLNQTPSAFRQLVEADGAVSGTPATSELALREVIFGGEALELSSLDPWFERHGDRRPRLVNMYGITETTVHVTYRPLTRSDVELGGSPVGVAIPDLSMRLVDRRGEVVPIGVLGEIWVGGAGLARGYLGRPRLTAERFVPDPAATASGTPGARAYRSGDLARYLANGDLDFLGRIDHQVKIRGFRIELGEIEASLQGHVAVRHAVVLALPDAAGDARLVAYVVPEGTAPTVGELRETVSATLPEYMVPQVVVWLDELPLTANGKLDRKALPDPAPAERTGDFEAPRNPIEESLAEIWSEVLGVEQIGAFDDFFELGGHSLRMTQVVSRIRDRFGVEIELPTLFTQPVLADQAREIQEASSPRVAAPPLEPLSDRERRLREGLALSFAQERLWFIDQLMPDSAAYNIPGLLELKGPLDIAAFRQALWTVVARHDSLRTRFVDRDGKPLQRIEESFGLDLPLHDLTQLAEERRRDELVRLAEIEAARPFDLAHAPLLRVTLVRLADHHHVMVVVMHHIVSDGWSLEVMLGEIESIYRARLAGVDPRLAPLAIQYPDFAVWQRDWLESGELDRQLEVWRRRLEGAPTILELPTDRPATAVRRSGPPVTRWSLLDQVDRVEGLARSHGATAFMVYLAVLHTLLGRLSGQETVLVGSPIANRTRSETEGLIGFFVNTLVLRGDLGGDPSFATLLGRVRETTLEAYGHQDLPFEHLVGELAPERSLDHTPFFRVVFNLQRVPPQLEGAPSTEDEERLSIEPMTLEVATPKFDLAVHFQEVGGQGDGRIFQQWSGRAELFDPTTIERFRRRYDLLLEGVLADPKRRLIELSLLGRSEQHQLTAEWNSPLSSFPARGTIDAAIAAQTVVRGDAVAVVGDIGSLTYRQLDERANRLAHHLRAHGAGPEVLVGVAMERGMELVVALLAILRSGAAYLPIDSSYPRDRLAFMLDDAGAPLLLGERLRAEDLPEFSGRVLLLDDPAEQSAIAARPATAPAIEADPGRLAYVIYTSGSTGLPKGVLIPHRNVMRLMTATESWFRFGPDDVWTFFHSHAFDFSVWEIWGCLVTGGRLVVVPYLTSRSPSAFRQLLADEGVTVLNQTPSAFRQLVEADGAASGTTDTSELALREVIFGGEALELSSLDPWFERHGDRRPRLVNMYGITETTVHVTYRPLTRSDVEVGGSPVGVAIPDLSMRLVDRRGEVVPIGVLGEIWVGGAGLARGYLGRPRLTAERFVPDPAATASGTPGARAYRSGDLARYLANGDLDFLGRIDHQVKIRGFRIELGEIEASLQGHVAVRHAVVLALPDAAGDARLVAYVVSEGAAPTVGELRETVSATLPEYMVPQVVVWLDELPLTANGKLDRKALPEPDSGRGSAAYEAPRNPIEEGLAEIWSEVLGVERVGAFDDFFELGGHSLRMTQVVSRIRDHFGVEIDLPTLFTQPVLADLAQEIETTRTEAAPPLQPLADRGRRLRVGLPLSFAQERLWFLDQLMPGSTAYNIPGLLELTGPLDVEVFRQALQALIERHDSLRTRFVDHGGEPRQVVEEAADFEIPLHDLSRRTEDSWRSELEALAMTEASRPFDLGGAPLLRMMLVRRAPEHHVAVVVMHHIVSDGWSLEVMLREIDAFYRAFSAGEAAPLEPLAIQYPDFAVWQRDWLESGELDRQLDVWRRRLEGAPPVLELPTDRPPSPLRKPGPPVTRTALLEGVDRVEAFAKGHGATPFMVYLAVLQALLGRLAGQDTVMVGSPIANRTRSETEGLIGFFVNTLVLRGDLAGDPSFETLLARVREVTVEAFGHQDLPFERLVDELAPERSLDHTPLFQTIFNLQSLPTVTEEARDGSVFEDALRIEPMALDVATSKFDLSVQFQEAVSPLGGGASQIFQQWSGRAELFDGSTLERLRRMYDVLLAEVLAAPDRPLREIALLGPAERQQTLCEWSEPRPDYRTGGFAHQWVMEHARNRPEAVAVVLGDQSWTYRELATTSAGVALRLRDLGVGPGSVVGVCLGRSFEMVAAVLGVLRAGGAYLPLDPSYPDERLAMMVQDAGAVAVLAGVDIESDRVAAIAGGRSVVPVAEALTAAATEALEVPTPALHEHHPAYVIYTSGSTGKPKGVVISHRAMANRLGFDLRAEGGDAIRYVQFSPFGFDMSMPQIFLALVAGEQLVLLRGEDVGDPDAIAAVLQEVSATHVGLPPAVLDAVLDRIDPARLPALRQVVSGGEALTWDTVRRFQQRFLAPKAGKTTGTTTPLMNRYGPTEATVAVTSWTFPEVAPGDLAGRVPIGRPIAKSQLVVVDDRLRPQPRGVAGELLVGGLSLALGYLDRPALTAERFVPNPFGAVDERGPAGRRLYRTGDRVRWRADGALEFLGRIDHQVKIRGHRVELGEIEVALLAHPAVREATVVDLPDGTTRRLAAYVVLEAEAGDVEVSAFEVSDVELRDHLLRTLPDYMVPSAMVTLEALPRTPAGKVDRRQLPEVVWSGGGAAPETETERRVAEIWGEVLGAESVGRDDDFFDLGGHSLLATRVVARLREELEVELPLRVFFEAPTVAGVAEHVDRSATGTALRPLEPTEWSEGEALPLSFAQDRLWFLDRFDPGSPVYNMPLAVRLRGELDGEALGRALDALVARHASLRTRFVEDGGEGRQQVEAPWHVEMEEIDLGEIDMDPGSSSSGAPQGAAHPSQGREPLAASPAGQFEIQESHLSDLLRDETLAPFDLAVGRLLRASKVRLADDHHVLLLTLHHIVSDGWSMQLLIRELGEFYTAFAEGRAPALDPLPLHYVDYALWQRRVLEDGGELDRQIEFWRSRLGDAPRVLELPLDRPRPARLDPAGATVGQLWPRPMLEGLETLARTLGTTLFAVVLAVFQAVLARLTGQRDLVIGTPVANRQQLSTENLIGFFVNTLALRGDLSGDPTLEELIERAHDAVTAAQDHQDVPFERLVDLLQPERELSTTPLFQVSLVVQAEGTAAPELSGLSLEAISPPTTTTKFDLTFSTTPTPWGLRVAWEYRSTLFDATTIRRFDRTARNLLASALDHPAMPFSGLDLLDTAERHQALVEWSAPATRPGRAPALVPRIVARLQSDADDPALVFDGEELTFGDLDRSSARLAARLRSAGVGRESVVALLLERSPSLVISALAVWRAGGAYVPLDPDHPEARQVFQLDDSGARWLIGQGDRAEQLVATTGVQGIDPTGLDETHRDVADAVASAGSDPEPRQLAYVLYTSGSTGRPKGVEVTHDGLSRYVDWAIDAYGAEGGSGTLVHSPLGFDLTVTGLWVPLAAGRPVTLIPETAGVEGLEQAMLDADDLTLVKLTPSHLELLRHRLPNESLAGRSRALVIGGEALYAEMLAPWRRHAPKTRLVNEYGPTETVVGCCVEVVGPGNELTPEARGNRGAVAIGRPITGAELWVVDDGLCPVPLGCIGELMIGGEGVARGYRGRPALTAERFVPDPFGSEPGARLYRSGDRVRALADGRLVYLGRDDSQVKIRGHRIELGEIEAAVLALGEVDEGVVEARPDATGELALVAYVVALDGAKVDPQTLRRQLAETLPSVWVPSAFVVLDALPLTANGKVDRRALPDPEAPRAEGGEAPRTPTEVRLAEIWGEVLGVQGVGIDDNFFALGGHSLRITQVASRIRDQLALELPLPRLFELPRLADLAAEIDRLRSDASTSSAPPLEPLDDRAERIAEGVPASYAQGRLWFLDQLMPGSAAYNIRGINDLEGPFDDSAFDRAVAAVIARHETLRTRFVGRDGEPHQVVEDEVELPVTRIDLTTEPESLRVAAAHRQAAQEAGRPFDLSRAPLFRVAVLRLAAERHLVVVVLHHIVSDGWSMGVLLRELGTFYHAFTHDDPKAIDRLPVLPLQYADFSAWQRSWLESGELDRQLDVWRRRLEGAPTVLELVPDRPPSSRSAVGPEPPVRSQGERRDLAAIEALARRCGATPFMVYLAVLHALLGRLTGQGSVLVGTPIANRTRSETEGLIGFFVNTLVLRGDLVGDPDFLTLLDRVREITLEAYANQDLPFERLVDELAPDRSLDHTPLFQVIFNLQRDADVDPEAEDLGLAPISEDVVTSKFDLSVSFGETSQRLEQQWNGRRRLYDGSTVARMARMYDTLLSAVLAEPERPMASHDVLAPAERHQLLVEWNEPRPDYVTEGFVHHRMLDQAARRGDALAILHGDQRLTYHELDRASARVAADLQGLGVGPGSIVGLCLDRSFGQVASIFGVLRAGGAYLPLDPSYPVERLAQMADDAAVAAVVLGSDLASELATALEEGRPAMVVDPADPLAGAPDTVTLVDPALELDHPAYVIYTSGSTGRPKGVVISHRAMSNRLTFDLRSEAGRSIRYTQFAPFGFDMSMPQVFVPLITGGTLVLLRSDDLGDPDYLMSVYESSAVTHAALPPGVLDTLLERTDLDRLRGIRQVVSGGEALAWRTVDRFQQRLPETQLINRYGPTEATVAVTSWPFPPAARDDRSRRVPIGRPIAKSAIHVVDADLRTVPRGVAGELVIGGQSLALGYLHRPAQTAERFVPDPFPTLEDPDRGGRRLYRTGDLARFRPDGALEFLGRIDYQVKIRGHRVELGEIEVALLTHPAVVEATVVDLPDGNTRRLAAYVVFDPGAAEGEAAEVDSSDVTVLLREHLSTRLPDVMVPSVFVRMGGLPRTPAGKVDRKRLPEPEWRSGSAAPETPLEHVVAEIWCQVLGRDSESVGRDDDFFELGGHSLLATRVVARVRETLGLELPLRVFFESPTVAGLASWVESIGEAGRSALSPLQATPWSEGELLPLSFAQERLWFLDQLNPDSPLYNIPSAVRVRGALDSGVISRALSQIVRRHVSLRTTFLERDGVGVQRVDPPWIVEVPVDELGHLDPSAAEERAEELVREEARRTFDLASGRLLRCRLIRLAPDHHLLTVTFHHIVADGASIPVFIRELGAFCTAEMTGRPSDLEPLPIQYVDYSLWQRKVLEEEGELERQVEFWRGQLEGAPRVLELPTDRPRPPRVDPAGASWSAHWPQPLVEGLEGLARQHGTTFFVALLGLFQGLFSRLSGQRDVVVGTPVANRQQLLTEDLIGFFVNTLALRGDLSGTPSLGGHLDRLRQAVHAAQDHQDVPFERLVDVLQPERELSTTPLFQVFLVVQNPQAEAPSLGGLSFEPATPPVTTAKFDLSLVAIPGAGGLRIAWQHRTSLFDETTIRRFDRSVRTLLASALETPDRPLAELPLLDRRERHQLLTEWNDLERLRPDVTLVDLLLAQVRATPDATAVIDDASGGALSFAALDRLSNRLAHRLRERGIGPDVQVGVYLERSLDLVVALVAILKAGGAYVPLDPGYPAERLAFMVSDAGLGVVVTNRALSDRLPETSARRTLVDEELGKSWDEAVARAEADPVAATPPLVPLAGDHLLYVIYTSGSTGKPKGALNPHRAVVNRMLWLQDTFQLGADDRVMQKTPISFDVSVWELFWPLTSGATMVLAAPGGHLDARYLGQLISRRRITTMHFVPSMMRLFLDEPEVAVSTSLRRVVASGEALPADLEERFFERFEVPLYNMYGPSEAARASWWTCERPARPGVAPIGRPIPNVDLHVVDDRFEPTGIGVPGELVIGGDTPLARGYHRRPRLTAERFVPDPLGASGGRLYRTGDRVRFLADGDIEFLGRIDFQVKIRGVRVEPGEIETVLTRLDTVREAAVRVHELRPGDQRLVAYFVPEAGAEPTSESLREALAAQLPDTLVPSMVCRLDAMPLLPSGKVDRLQLPAPEEVIGPEVEYVPPRDDLERTLVEIFEELLVRSPVGIEDDFFALGGHSLLAVRLLSAIRQRTGYDPPLVSVFQRGTVAALASQLRGDADSGGPLVALSPRGDRTPFYCVHPVAGMAFCYRALADLVAERSGYRQPIYGVRSEAFDDFDNAPRSVEGIAAGYIAALRRQQPKGPYILGGWSFGGIVAWEMAQQLQAAGEDVAQVVLFDTAARDRRVSAEDADEVELDGLLQRVGEDTSDEMISKILEQLVADGQVPPGLTVEEFRLILRVDDLNRRASHLYQPLPYDGPVLLLRAIDRRSEDPYDWGWGALAPGLEIREVPGNHDQLMASPNVEGVAKVLSASLEEIHEGGAAAVAVE